MLQGWQVSELWVSSVQRTSWEPCACALCTVVIKKINKKAWAACFPLRNTLMIGLIVGLFNTNNNTLSDPQAPVCVSFSELWSEVLFYEERFYLWFALLQGASSTHIKEPPKSQQKDTNPRLKGILTLIYSDKSKGTRRDSLSFPSH